MILQLEQIIVAWLLETTIQIVHYDLFLLAVSCTFGSMHSLCS